MTLRRAIVITIICLVAAIGLLCAGCANKRPVTLMVHAGAGIRPALDELGALFQKKTGIRVEYNYKGSGCLLPDILASEKGDVYLPGELYYMQQALDRGLVHGYRTVTNLTTVLIVQAGNPKKIERVEDMARPGVRVGMGDPEVVAVGRAAREVMEKAGVWTQVEKRVAMAGQNVSEVSNAVKLGHIDAAIVWDACAALYTDREIMTMQIPERLRVVSPVSAGELKFSRNPKQAQQYVDFLASDEAAEVFGKHGFSSPVPPKQRERVTKGGKA